MEFINQDVLCIGEVLWDSLPDGKIPGGAPMNVALHLHQLGHNVLMASSLGNDKAGSELLIFLRNAGLKTGLIQTDFNLPTSEVLVHLDENNNPSYEIVEPVAWDNIKWTSSLADVARSSGIVIYGTLASRKQKSRETIISALSYNNVKLIDVNLRPPFDKQEPVETLIGYADIAKMNEDEIITIAGWHDYRNPDLSDLTKWFADTFNIDMVCITRGENGASLLDKGKILNHKGFKINEVDTVGAGDAFLAGFTSSLMEGKSSEEALNFACATGSYVATKKGATPEYYMREIEMILNQK